MFADQSRSSRPRRWTDVKVITGEKTVKLKFQTSWVVCFQIIQMKGRIKKSPPSFHCLYWCYMVVVPAMKQCFDTWNYYYYGFLLELVLHLAKETTQLEVQPIIVVSSVIPWSQSRLNCTHQLIKGGQRQLTALLIPLCENFKRWAILVTSAPPPPLFLRPFWNPPSLITWRIWLNQCHWYLLCSERFVFCFPELLLSCCRGVKSSAGINSFHAAWRQKLFLTAFSC